MRQRIMIALAVVLEPRVLIADEPTTSLDVLVEAQILDLLTDLRRRLGLAVVLITHNLGIVAETCDRVAVMYAGRIVEEGPVADVFAAAPPPLHAGPAQRRHHPGDRGAGRRPRARRPTSPAPSPAAPSPPAARWPWPSATRWSRAADSGRARRTPPPATSIPAPTRPTRPRPGSPPAAACASPNRPWPEPSDEPGRSVRVQDLRGALPIRRAWRRSAGRRRSSGRSTASASRSRRARRWASSGRAGAGRRRWAGRCCGSSSPPPGRVEFEGRDITSLGGAGAPAAAAADAARVPGPPRRPQSGHDHRRRGRPPAAASRGCPRTGRRPGPGRRPCWSGSASRRPAPFSTGSRRTSPAGQKQRIVLARALVTGPSLVVADEPVAMLDMSVRALVLDLMAELRPGTRAHLRVHHPRPGHRPPPV